MKIVDAGVDLNKRLMTLKLDTEEELSLPIPVEVQSTGNPMADILNCFASVVFGLHRRVEALEIAAQYPGQVTSLDDTVLRKLTPAEQPSPPDVL